MIVFGLAEKQGTFNGQDYHNVTIYCSTDEKDIGKSVKKRVGEITQEIKLSYGDFDNLNLDMNRLVGASIKPVYNRFGKVVEVEVIE
jgi:hypothetical protein